MTDDQAQPARLSRAVVEDAAKRLKADGHCGEVFYDDQGVEHLCLRECPCPEHGEPAPPTEREEREAEEIRRLLRGYCRDVARPPHERGAVEDVEYHYVRRLARLRTHSPEEPDKAIRYEDGHPHVSHRWERRPERSPGSPAWPWVCADCEVNIEDDEALDVCASALASPEEPVVEGYVPNHWRETLDEYPSAIIGFVADLSDHDAEVEKWVRVELRPIGQPLDTEEE